MELVFTYLCWC